jgi:dienelactone hydrolase
VLVGHVIGLHQIALTTTFIETDKTFPKESRRRAEDILEEVGATYHVQIFSGVTHGFGTRGDPAVENSRMFFLFQVNRLKKSWIIR